jgi:hypothetical protein
MRKYTVGYTTLNIVRGFISSEEVGAWELSDGNSIVAYFPADFDEDTGRNSKADAELVAKLLNEEYAESFAPGCS